jgi:hypothetical protein
VNHQPVTVGGASSVFEVTDQSDSSSPRFWIIQGEGEGRRRGEGGRGERDRERDGRRSE